MRGLGTKSAARRAQGPMAARRARDSSTGTHARARGRRATEGWIAGLWLDVRARARKGKFLSHVRALGAQASLGERARVVESLGYVIASRRRVNASITR